MASKANKRKRDVQDEGRKSRRIANLASQQVVTTCLTAQERQFKRLREKELLQVKRFRLNREKQQRDRDLQIAWNYSGPDDLSAAVANLPLVLLDACDYPFLSHNPKIPGVTRVVRYLIEDFTCLPLALGILVEEYIPSVIAFDRRKELLGTILFEWLSVLRRRKSSFDTRLGGLLLGKDAQISFQHHARKRRFEFRTSPKFPSHYDLDCFRYGHHGSTLVHSLHRLCDSLWNIVSGNDMVVIPFLLDRGTWSPVAICWNVHNVTVLNLNHV